METEFDLPIMFEDGTKHFYKFDYPILDGLAYTTNIDKINHNIKAFKIVLKKPYKNNFEAQVAPLSKGLCILTINNSNNLYQFLVMKSLNPKKLSDFPNENLSQDLKDFIMQAYEIAISKE